MPKKGRKAVGKAGDSCLMPFHTLSTSNLSGGVNGFLLSPNASLSPRALVEADAWAHFRVRSFSFRLHPSAFSIACGVVGGVQDTPPGSVVQVMELLPSCFISASSQVPTEWIHVGKSDLSGPLPWYKTIPGTADPTEESPGTVRLAGGATDTFALEMRGVFEFKTSVASGNTPLALAALTRMREERIQFAVRNERALLMKILTGSSATPAVVVQGTTGVQQSGSTYP